VVELAVQHGSPHGVFKRLNDCLNTTGGHPPQARFKQKLNTLNFLIFIKIGAGPGSARTLRDKVQQGRRSS
jgi:hypothetical protein